MRIAILEAGKPHPILASISYPEMLELLLGDEFEFAYYDVQGAFYPADGSFDAVIITGSSSSVYDPDEWIRTLQAWLNDLPGEVPLIGICFGHQVMATAFGGEVARSEKGLGIGFQEYKIANRCEWMDDAQEVVLPLSHMDQVITPPSGAQATLTNGFCPVAGLAYSNRRAISFQSHPEFSPEFTERAVDLWRARGTIDDITASDARNSISQADDRERVGSWIRHFIRQSGK